MWSDIFHQRLVVIFMLSYTAYAKSLRMYGTGFAKGTDTISILSYACIRHKSQLLIISLV